jgi:hypothetical protein
MNTFRGMEQQDSAKMSARKMLNVLLYSFEWSKHMNSAKFKHIDTKKNWSFTSTTNCNHQRLLKRCNLVHLTNEKLFFCPISWQSEEHSYHLSLGKKSKILWLIIQPITKPCQTPLLLYFIRYFKLIMSDHPRWKTLTKPPQCERNSEGERGEQWHTITWRILKLAMVEWVRWHLQR